MIRWAWGQTEIIAKRESVSDKIKKKSKMRNKIKKSLDWKNSISYIFSTVFL